MVHLTLAISDFMVMLIGAALWLALEFAAVVMLALLAAGGAGLLTRALWRRLRRYGS